MAEIAIAIGTSHTPLLTFGAEHWERYSRRDLSNSRLNLSDGRWISYDNLLADTGGKFALEATREVFNRKSAACQAALDRLADELEAAKPDVVVIVTDDQAELFHQTNLPAISIFYGDEVKTMPRANIAHMRHIITEPFFGAMSAAYAMDKARTFPGKADFARELIERLIDKDIDIGGAAAVEDPEKAGLGHGIGFVIQRLFKGRAIPVIPVLLNTYYPPNAPTASRCFAIGQALRAAIEESPTPMRVALVASGGLSHFVVDEDLDMRVLHAMGEGNGADLKALTKGALNSGSSEIRNWILVGGAIENMKKRWFEYQALYRQAAGTGIGVAFGVWGH
ncbi:MAG: hypothetical protein EXR28_07560 [Betaproteobacteria bacterium]|nr:hypothetical protein [Betaproteobacteria bacterium]